MLHHAHWHAALGTSNTPTYQHVASRCNITIIAIIKPYHRCNIMADGVRSVSPHGMCSHVRLWSRPECIGTVPPGDPDLFGRPRFHHQENTPTPITVRHVLIKIDRSETGTRCFMMPLPPLCSPPCMFPAMHRLVPIV